MAKKTTQGALETYTFRVPVTDDTGKTWTTVLIEDPELRHEAQVDRATTSSDMAAFALRLSTLTGMPVEAVHRIKFRDANALRDIIERLKDRGVKLDAEREAEERARNGGIPAPVESVRTFELIVPIPTDGAPMTHITVTEPDIASGIAVERFKTGSEQTAALIASCSGQIIPLIMRMKVCDTARIERWINFLLQDGATLPPPSPKAGAADSASADGATSP